MNQKNGAIVVFDSGVGGISVLRQLVRLMPQEHFLYFGDSANAPYGCRTTEEIRKLTMENIHRLYQRGAKAIVIACNTATAAAVDALREQYPGDIVVGIEPAVKLAVEQFPTGRIVVMATETTLREQKYQDLTSRFEKDCEIIPLPCRELVGFVERGELSSEEINAYLRRQLGPILEKPIDAVVLGCTHFPFARKAIQQVVGQNVVLLDGGEGTARETRRRILAQGLENTQGSGSVTFENSLNTDQMLKQMQALLDYE